MAAVALAGRALIVAPAAAQAQTVSTPGSIAVPCSTTALVTAINTANVRGGATIALAANCTYFITVPSIVTDGLPVITGRITMTGGSDTVIERNAVALFRILEVASGGNLSLNDISIRDGHTAGLGGGILNGGTLTVTHAEFSGNTAGNGGGLANSAGATASVYNTLLESNTTTGVGGGGIINSGDLMVVGTTFNEDTAPINGGALNTQGAGDSQIYSSSFSQNTSGGLGGAISNLGTTSLSTSEVRLNTGSAGGGIATSNNNVTLHTSIVRDNTPDNCSPLNTIPGCVN